MEATLKAEKRQGRGKNEARRLRASGRIPAVLYGAEKGKAIEIAVDPKNLLRILHSEAGVNTLIGLELDGGGTRVLVKEYQLDPIDHKLLHADFYQVAMDKTITVTVPVVLKGEPKGVKQQGGIVDFVHRDIEIEVLPADIPENITVDISELMLHEGVRVRDLQTEGAKWKATSDADMMIVHVVPMRAEEVAPAPEVAATAAAPAEPEVIKKGKTEKEGEEKAEKAEKAEKK
jgi:large subunit ribosomal protein L25